MTRSTPGLSEFRKRLQSGLTRLVSDSKDHHAPPVAADDERFDVSNPWAVAYLDTRAETQLSKDSVERYDNNLQEFTSFLDNRGTSVLDAELTDVIEYVEQCVARNNRQSTIEGKLTTVKELYKFIRLRTDAGDNLSLDPIEINTINLDKYNTPPPIQREPLTRQELRRLFDAMDSYRNRLMTILAIETGIRNSDLRNLRLTDVDFEDSIIHVRNPKNGRPYDAPISRELTVELEIWCDEYQPEFGGRSKSAFLFPGHNQERITTNEGLNQIVKTAADEAGIQEVIDVSDLTPAQQRKIDTETEQREWHRVTVHTLRHTCFTLMKESGVPLQYRQVVANHSSPTMTQHYSHGKEEEFGVIRDRFDPPL